VTKAELKKLRDTQIVSLLLAELKGARKEIVRLTRMIDMLIEVAGK
jgi:hypothetical protein